MSSIGQSGCGLAKGSQPMSTMKSLLRLFQQKLSRFTSPREAEDFFETLLLQGGWLKAEPELYKCYEAQLLDPLHLNYPKVSRQDKWFARNPYLGGSNFLITLGGHIFPLDIRVTSARRNPSWGNRIVPSIGAYVAAELETGDLTILLCGPYSSRTEKRLLKEIQASHDEFLKRLNAHEGAQIPHATLLFTHDQSAGLIYESPKRRTRENEAHLLISHFEGNA